MPGGSARLSALSLNGVSSGAFFRCLFLTGVSSGVFQIDLLFFFVVFAFPYVCIIGRQALLFQSLF
jgi:hypothetical protein